jgi:hypothetical protein
MSDLPDHCNSSAHGLSGAERSGPIITSTENVSILVPPGFSIALGNVTSESETEFSFLRFSIQHDGIGPQRVDLYIDVDGAPTFVCVATFTFEKSITHDFNLLGGWHSAKIFGYYFEVWNFNYIPRNISLFASVVEVPK